VVNMIAQFGGLIGPWLIGWVKTSTGSFTIALMVVSAFLFLAAAIALAMRVTPREVGGASHAPPKPGIRPLATH